jgi:hypothetical protein
MKRALIPSAIAVVLVAGCGSLGTGSPPQGSPAPPASPASAPPCTTDACIVTDIKGLVGTVAKDDSVMTKVTCKTGSVSRKAAGVWTATCTVTYSDGDVAKGIGTVDETQDEVTFEPASVIPVS